MSDEALIPRAELLEEIERLRARLSGLESRQARDLALEGAPSNRQILDVIPSGVVHVSPMGAILFANQDAQALLGLSYDELTDRYVADFDGETLREDGTPCPVEEYPVSRCLSTGKPQIPTVIGVRRPGGDVVWALFTAIPTVPDAEGHTGAVVTFVNVTERQRARKEHHRFTERLRHAQKMEALGRLASGVAHDMNNVLATIMGISSAIKQELPPSVVQSNDLENILNQCLRGRDLLQNLLGFARGGAGDRRAFSLNETIREVEGILSRTLKRGVSLEVSLDPHLECVEGDPDQMLHALMNLCINASDAIDDEGSITLTTRNETTKDGPGSVVLCVSDDGAGMSDEVAAQAFDPFFTTKPQEKGTGLGLFMVYGTVKNHGGEIHIESTPSQGTTFTITLPSSGAAPAKTSSPAVRSEAGSGRVLLLMDGDRQILRANWRVLRALGHVVHIAASTKSARETFALHRQEIDLIILDVYLDSGDCRETLLAIREIAPVMPVLISTHREDEPLLDDLRALGISGVLHKPFEVDKVEKAVEDALDA